MAPWRDWIARMQKRERERTGISSLKIGYSQVFGYYIAVSKANLDRVPEDYTRQQTLANVERFITPELKEQEAKVLQADERIGQLEAELFTEVRDRVATWSEQVQTAARAVAQIDVLTGFGILKNGRCVNNKDILSEGNRSGDKHAGSHRPHGVRSASRRRD